MSTNLDLEKRSISARLVEERKRLHITQPSAQVMAGCGRQAWVDKEMGRSPLHAHELLRLSEHGFDVYYIVTGRYALGQLSALEAHVLDTLRDMDPRSRSILLGSVLGWTFPDRITKWLSAGFEQTDDPFNPVAEGEGTPAPAPTRITPRRGSAKNDSAKSGNPE